MPLYDYECEQCGVIENVWARMDDQYLECQCGQMMHRIITASNINPDLQPYYDENLCDDQGSKGTWVESRQHRIRRMQELGLTNAYGEAHKQRWV